MNDPLLWAEIDLGAIAENVRELKRITSPAARFMAVVKANAYGHGAMDVARTALDAGADRLGVARWPEALALREAGIAVPILVLGRTAAEHAARAADLGITLTVWDLPTAEAFSRAVPGGGPSLTIHTKVDTGMGRLGLPAVTDPEDDHALDTVAQTILTVAKLPGIRLEGAFTHFAESDGADKSHARLQFARFSAVMDRIRAAGLAIPIRHAANSAAIIDLPETHLDMVRAGIAMYGLPPSADVALERVRLTPAMALKARIIHVKPVPAGFFVSYGRTHRTPAPTVIATVPVGYGDGYSRGLSNRGVMLVHGRRVPVVGRVCMDLTMLDVGEIDDVAVGDEVVVFGRQEDETLGADELAGLLATINYEIVTAIAARVPRIYRGTSIHNESL